MLNKLTSDQLKVILLAMGSTSIKGSDAIAYAEILTIIGTAYDKKREKEEAADSV